MHAPRNTLAQVEWLFLAKSMCFIYDQFKSNAHAQIAATTNTSRSNGLAVAVNVSSLMPNVRFGMPEVQETSVWCLDAVPHHCVRAPKLHAAFNHPTLYIF